MTLLRETFDINNIHPILVVVGGRGGEGYRGSCSPFSIPILPPPFLPSPYLISPPLILTPSLSPILSPFSLPSFYPLPPPFSVSLPLSHALSPPCTPVLCSPLLRWVGDILKINTIVIRDKMKTPLNQGQHKRSTRTVELTEPKNISGRSVPTGCLYAYWK